MHEIGLGEAVIQAVDRRAAGRRVTGVRVRVGVRHRVDEASFRQGFELVALGTCAEGAELTFVAVPAALACRGCGAEALVLDPLATCPECGCADVVETGGDELTLESIEVAAGARVGGEDGHVPGNSR